MPPSLVGALQAGSCRCAGSCVDCSEHAWRVPFCKPTSEADLRERFAENGLFRILMVCHLHACYSPSFSIFQVSPLFLSKSLISETDLYTLLIVDGFLRTCVLPQAGAARFDIMVLFEQALVSVIPGSIKLALIPVLRHLIRRHPSPSLLQVLDHLLRRPIRINAFQFLPLFLAEEYVGRKRPLWRVFFEIMQSAILAPFDRGVHVLQIQGRFDVLYQISLSFLV